MSATLPLNQVLQKKRKKTSIKLKRLRVKASRLWGNDSYFAAGLNSAETHRTTFTFILKVSSIRRKRKHPE